MILRRCNPFLTTTERKPEAAQAPFEAWFFFFSAIAESRSSSVWILSLRDL